MTGRFGNVTDHFGHRDRRFSPRFCGICCLAVLRRELNPGVLTSTAFALRSQMPKPRMSLRMIKDVIRLKWQADLSHEQIASTLNISKGAVAKYVGLTHAAGLDWETIQDWSEQRLTSTLLPKANTSQPYITPDWGRIHRELDRKGVTLMLLWQEYVEVHPHGRTWRYTQFCGHYKDYAQTLKRSMTLPLKSGVLSPC